MNAGVISSRYARALLAFSLREGDADTLCRQAALLLQRFDEVPQLRKLLSDKTLGKDDTGQLSTLLQAAIGDEALTPSLERFLSFVQQKGRMGYLRLMLHSFTEQYYREKGIRRAILITAVPPTEALLEKYRAVAGRRFGGTIQLESVIDPSIIGGAILTVDGHRLDASLAGQLERLRNELKEKNKRIV